MEIRTRVENPIAPRQRNTSRPHQIVKGVRAVCDLPAALDRTGVPGGAQHDLRAFVSALPRDFGELPVVADDVRHSDAARPIEDGDPTVAWVPRFYRHPGVQFAVVVDQFALFVYDQAGVPRHAERVGFHDGEAAPDCVLRASFFQGGDLGALEGAHYFLVCEHGEAVEAVFGEDDHVHLRVGFPRFADERTDVLGGGFEVLGGLHGEELGLAEADYDGVVEGLVEAA